jgi:hypothetical protein
MSVGMVPESALNARSSCLHWHGERAQHTKVRGGDCSLVRQTNGASHRSLTQGSYKTKHQRSKRQGVSGAQVDVGATHSRDALGKELDTTGPRMVLFDITRDLIRCRAQTLNRTLQENTCQTHGG